MFSHGLHSSCSMFSHGIHGIHRTFLPYILPQIAQIFTDAAFMVHLSICFDLLSMLKSKFFDHYF